MKISLRKKSPGFALMALLCCLVVILIVFASIMSWISTNGQQMRKNETFTSSEAAAEGESEFIFAHMDRDYLQQNLNPSASFYESWLPPATDTWPVQYTFSNTVTIGEPSAVLSYLGSEYTNLLGLPQTIVVTVTATPSGQTYNVPATVSQTFVFASIPAFQFAIFYNMNLEIDPGAPMPITGAVFSNGSIWSGTGNVTYNWTVEAAGQVNTTGTDPFMTGKTDSGTPQANFLYTGTPVQPESNVNPLVIPIGATGGGTNNNSTNVEAIINIPPASVLAPQSIAYEPTNLTYDFNAASLIVSNWNWGSNGVAPWSNNFTVYLQDSVSAPSAVQSNGVAMNWIMLTNDCYLISNRTALYQGLWPNNANPLFTNHVPNFHFANNMSTIRWINTIATNGPVGTNCVWYAGYSFLTETNFYDYRESATVQAVLLDVGKLGAWITSTNANGGANWNYELSEDTGHGINSIFIDNTVPFIGQSQLPAVQVWNGWQLPYSLNVINHTNCITKGLTVVTPQPLYAWGSYNVQTNGGPVVLGAQNTVNTYPAAFLADAITVLSSNWSDSDNSQTALGSRTPLPTTINAGCLEGIVPSYNANYCGGVENFIRLLENWSSGSTPLTYNGSIMVMFPSIYATNIWQETGNYYNAPQRVWGFDTNFLTQTLLPPLTPQFRAVIRNTWSGY
jgi:hypothetical protein